ncbi:MAG: translation elongation factor Ts [bacterium]
MIITASLVKELRERIGAGMMECKKALEEAQGDIEAAIVAMRKSGQAKAAKKASRIAAEGVVAIKTSGDGKKAIMVEVNCETDFVARDHSFLEFVNAVATAGLAALSADIDSLLAAALDNGKTIAQTREDLVAKVGENINVRRLKLITTAGVVGSYVHSNNRIGVLVELSAASPEFGKDISMHIAASKPIVVLPEELPQDLLNKEKEICLAQVQTSGKPPEIIEKMIAGRMQKFISESTLVEQLFVKNPDITVADLLKQANAKALSFARFEVGEGIERVKSLL